MGSGGSPAEKKPVDNETFYKTLNVSKDATADEIKKAFRKRALLDHPGKGGDPEKLKNKIWLKFVLSDLLTKIYLYLV